LREYPLEEVDFAKEAQMAMKWIFKSIAILMMIAFVGSCVTNGREFNSNMTWIQKGKTKMDDVRLVLGAPQSVGSSSGVPTWTYGYYKYNVFGNGATKEVKFYSNPDQTVNSFSYTSSFPDDVAASNNRQGTAPAAPAQQPRSAVGDVSRN